MAPTYDLSQTRNQIILRSLRICGVLAQGDDPTGEQVAEGAQALESLVKHLQSDNVFLWTQEDRTLTLADGDGEYNLGTDLLGVAYATVTGSDGYSYGVALVAEETFASVLNPTLEGRPEMAKVELSEQPTIKFHPIPDGTYTFKYKATRKMKDFDTALGTPEMPQRWFDPLCYLLAANLADEYQLPLDKCNYLRGKAAEMKERAGMIESDPCDVWFMRAI